MNSLPAHSFDSSEWRAAVKNDIDAPLWDYCVIYKPTEMHINTVAVNRQNPHTVNWWCAKCINILTIGSDLLQSQFYTVGIAVIWLLVDYLSQRKLSQ